MKSVRPLSIAILMVLVIAAGAVIVDSLGGGKPVSSRTSSLDTSISTATTTTEQTARTGASTSTSRTLSTSTSSTSLGGGASYVIIQEGSGSNHSLGYLPARLVVVLGVNSTVVWVNKDSVPHTVSSTSSVEPFNSGNLVPGGSYSYTFTSPGVYGYFCAYHGWMSAEVVVRG